MFNCKKLFKLQIRPPSLILLMTTFQGRWIFPSQSWEVRNSMMMMIIIIIKTVQHIISACPVLTKEYYRVILSLEAPNKFGKNIPEFGETHSSVFGFERRPVSALILSRSCFADISGTESNNIWELKLMNFKVTVRWKISDFYRGISYLQNGYQSTTNIVKDEKGDLITDSHSILARWRNHFSQLFNVQDVSSVR